ncbi:GPP34 family phosphoprotein [Dactylosporangium cerinum]|uniref:GPP34 family phosphoprotein n=1 Tax=Dactylosporangium cerinum TaxID=1434730 RepID=A0ABV9WBP5_9ACTN
MQPLSRLPLGDQVWFLFHSQYRPETLIAESLFNVVLGGALIAELWFDGHVEITPDGALAPSRKSPLADQSDSETLAGRPPHGSPTAFEQHAWKELNRRPALYPVRDWINFWATHGPDQVRTRMEQRGLLERVRRNTYMPVDPHVAAGPTVTQRYLIENGYHQFQQGDDVRQYYETAVNAGFMLATNLDLEISRDSTVPVDEFRARLQFMVTNLQTEMQFVLGEVGRTLSVQGRRPSRR